MLKIDSVAGDAININNGTVWNNDEGEAMSTSEQVVKHYLARFSEADAKPKAFDIKHPSIIF